MILPPLEVTCILVVTSARFVWMLKGTKVRTCLGCDDELVSDASFLGPLADEFFRCFVLARFEYEPSAAK
jgi:hypothetical protein